MMSNEQYPALFLDRDGVVNIDHGYVHSQDSFDWIPGIFDLVKLANKNGFKVIIVTNQSGIARELYSEEQFLTLTEWMLDEFEKHGCVIDGVYYCPHHVLSTNADYAISCDCRKPKPGMLFEAALDHQLILSESIFIGDRNSDTLAGFNANIPTRLLMLEHSDDTASSTDNNSDGNTPTHETASIHSHEQAYSYLTKAG